MTRRHMAGRGVQLFHCPGVTVMSRRLHWADWSLINPFSPVSLNTSKRHSRSPHLRHKPASDKPPECLLLASLTLYSVAQPSALYGLSRWTTVQHQLMPAEFHQKSRVSPVTKPLDSKTMALFVDKGLNLKKYTRAWGGQDQLGGGVVYLKNQKW